MAKFSCAGVILAGGLSTRLNGRDKAFIRIGGNTLLDRVHATVRDIFQEIVIVGNDTLEYLEWDCLVTADIFPARSSLTGIHAGLSAIRSSRAFFTGCDAPFLKKELIERLLAEAGPNDDVVIPETASGLEPLCAIYSKKCVRPIEANLRSGKFQIRRFFKSMRVKKVPEERLREKDPDLISFFNINTPENLARAEALLRNRTSATSGI